MFFNRKTETEDSSWISFSDLMTVLMATFLIISVIINKETTKSISHQQYIDEEVNNERRKLCSGLKTNLDDEIQDGMIRVECDPIMVKFVHEDFNFEQGESSLSPRFAEVLTKFWPIYYEAIRDSKLDDFPYKGRNIDLIEEIRVDGHTNSDNDYIDNTMLSQERARRVLVYLLRLQMGKSGDPSREPFELENFNREPFELENFNTEDLWLFEKVTANGLSFSKPLGSEKEWEPISLKQAQNGEEDKERSKRVEIVLRTNSAKILEMIKEENLYE